MQSELVNSVFKLLAKESTIMENAHRLWLEVMLYHIGINETMIEYCRFCIAGESCQNCVKVNGQNIRNARAKAKKIQHPDLHELQLAKRREQHAESVFVSF